MFIKELKQSIKELEEKKEINQNQIIPPRIWGDDVRKIVKDLQNKKIIDFNFDDEVIYSHSSVPEINTMLERFIDNKPLLDEDQ